MTSFPKTGAKLLKAATMGLTCLNVGLSVAFALLEETVEEKLDKLETKIMSAVAVLIADGNLEQDVTNAQKAMKANREIVLRDTAVQKYNLFTLNLAQADQNAKFIEDMDDIADSLKSKADNHYVELAKIIPSDIKGASIPTTATNIKESQYAFNTYLMGAMEWVSMAQDSIYLSAYLSNSYSCDQLLENVQFGVYVAIFKTNAQKMQQLLVSNRLSMITVKSLISSRCSKYCGWKAYDSFYGSVIYHTGSDSDKGSADEAANVLKSELSWDMKNVAYRIEEFDAAMNALVSTTKAQCLSLRPTSANNANRADYKTNILSSKPGFDSFPLLCQTNDC